MAKQKSKKPTRKVIVQALSAVMVAAIAAALTAASGEEVSADQIEWLDTFIQYFLYAALPPTVGATFAWIVPPSKDDQVIEG